MLLLVPTGWSCFQFPKGRIHGLYRKSTPRRNFGDIALANWQLLFFAKDDVKKYRMWHLNVPSLNQTVSHQITRKMIHMSAEWKTT
jgi:hypothetical protein